MPPIFIVTKGLHYEKACEDCFTKERLENIMGKTIDAENTESLELLIDNVKGSLFFGVIRNWNCLPKEKRKEELQCYLKVLDDITINYELAEICTAAVLVKTCYSVTSQ